MVDATVVCRAVNGKIHLLYLRLMYIFVQHWSGGTYVGFRLGRLYAAQCNRQISHMPVIPTLSVYTTGQYPDVTLTST